MTTRLSPRLVAFAVLAVSVASCDNAANEAGPAPAPGLPQTAVESPNAAEAPAAEEPGRAVDEGSGVEAPYEETEALTEIGVVPELQPPDGWSLAPADPRAQVARDAQVALGSALQARLLQTMQSEGPVAAMDVCAGEAQTITRRIATEHNLRIGRTAVRQRNVSNTVPDWATGLVALESHTPVSLLGPENVYAALTPIFMGAPCLNCHGEESDLAPGVSEAIARHYPQDEAVGFGAGDLRGWFWVEVDPR